MFQIFNNQGLLIDALFYSIKDAHDYGINDLRLGLREFYVRRVGFFESQAYTKEDF